jgi:hypothetical protein
MVLPANKAKKESAPSNADTYPPTIAIIIKLFLDIASSISALPDYLSVIITLFIIFKRGK